MAYYVKSNSIVAVASMQSDPIVTKASELFRLGLMPTAERWPVSPTVGLLVHPSLSSSLRSDFHLLSFRRSRIFLTSD